MAVFRIPVSLGTVAVAFGAALSIAAAQDINVPRSVLTYHNDIYRSGVYSAETHLNLSSVRLKQFGKLFSRNVIGQIWGQPLYVRGVSIGGTSHDVVYVATSENWVYGFDADDLSTDENTAPLAKIWLGEAAAIGPDTCHGFPTIFPSIGITSTPVIDASSGTLYVVAGFETQNADAAGFKTQYQVFALDLATFKIRKTDTIVGSQNGIVFEPGCQINRPALLLSSNHLVVAFGSGPDNDNPRYHGWVMSYSVPDLTQTGVFNTTPYPNSGTQAGGPPGAGSIWQAGAGPASDDLGNV